MGFRDLRLHPLPYFSKGVERLFLLEKSKLLPLEFLNVLYLFFSFGKIEKMNENYRSVGLVEWSFFLG